MFKLLPLIQNENIKIHRRIRTWIMVGILILINLTMALVMYLSGNPAQDMLQFASMSTFLFFFTTIFSIVIAGDIVASEFTWGTIKMLLIRPVSRTKILLSKFIAVIAFAIMLLIILLISSFVLGFLFFGTQGGDPALTFSSILSQYGYQFITLTMLLSLAFMISSVFRSSALAITLSFVFIFISASLVDLLSLLNYTWGKYLFISNTNLQMYAGDYPYPPFEGMTLGFSITVLAAYFVAFHLISFIVFKKRDVSI